MYRSLTECEIEQLKLQNNSADNWADVSVAGTFFVGGVRNSHFAGKVRIGKNVRLENVGRVENCKIDNNCLIQNVGELVFESKRSNFSILMPLCCEKERFTAVAVPGMNSTDVFLALSSKNESVFSDGAKNYSSGEIGAGTEIRNVSSIRNVVVGKNVIVENSCSIENSWIEGTSHKRHIRTRIGANVILQNAIVHKSTHISNNSILTGVLVGQNCEISDGARIYWSAVGDCSQISGCEIGHSFLYPFHAQHHSNSFVIAGHIQGQSNIAAGATLGSNHNAYDKTGEFVAGRGFWAGLCTSIAMPSRFAPFTLLVKGDYQYPIDNPLAFSLIGNNLKDNTLDILPGYWWIYKPLSLERNSEKYKTRDLRKNYTQYFEYAPLAPDTIFSIVESHKTLVKIVNSEINPHSFEKSGREVRILKIDEGIAAYEQMILHYCMSHFRVECERFVDEKNKNGEDVEFPQVVNVGGLLMTKSQFAQLTQNLESIRSDERHLLEKSHHFQSEIYKHSYDFDKNTSLQALQYLMKNAVYYKELSGTVTSKELTVFFDEASRALSEKKALQFEKMLSDIDANDFFCNRL